MPQLVVIYGAPLSGKTSVAREVAAALDSKSAIVSPDALFEDAIRVHDRDAYAELEMVYTQVKLLVANYLKSRYHVVLEGAFAHEIDGVLHPHEQEIDQTLGLMRNLAQSPLLVQLTATEATLRRRADASSRLRDADAALRIDAAYRQRSGGRSLALATDARSVADLSSDVMNQLRAEYF